MYQPHQYGTRGEAWRAIARIVEEKGCEFGLCRIIASLQDAGDIHWSLGASLREQVREHMAILEDRPTWDGAVWRAYFDDPGVESTRILAALFLAEEAEDEERNAPRIVVDEWRGDTHHVRVEIRAE